MNEVLDSTLSNEVKKKTSFYSIIVVYNMLTATSPNESHKIFLQVFIKCNKLMLSFSVFLSATALLLDDIV